jgi:hypothetical protein
MTDMETQRPKRGFLYTWNFFDGFLGEPVRRIAFKRTSPSLLELAYLGGGERWDGKSTPSGAVLRLHLKASPWRQSVTNYERSFDGYRTEELTRTFSAKVEELSGLDRALWEVEIPCLGLSSEEIDDLIERVLEWHKAEVVRIGVCRS